MSPLSWKEEPLKLWIIVHFFSFSSALCIFTPYLYILYITPAAVIRGVCKCTDADEQQIQPSCR